MTNSDESLARRAFWEDKKFFGKPCKDYEPECVSCIHFEMIDYMRGLEKENAKLRSSLAFLEKEQIALMNEQGMTLNALNETLESMYQTNKALLEKIKFLSKS